MKNKMKRKKYYIAYGNSLSVGQMMQRCPGAQIVGQAVLVGWELLFRGCATIAPNPKKNTPALVRRADIQVCNRCGNIEAMEDFAGNKSLLADWAIVKAGWVE